MTKVMDGNETILKRRRGVTEVLQRELQLIMLYIHLTTTIRTGMKVRWSGDETRRVEIGYLSAERAAIRFRKGAERGMPCRQAESSRYTGRSIRFRSTDLQLVRPSSSSSSLPSPPPPPPSLPPPLFPPLFLPSHPVVFPRHTSSPRCGDEACFRSPRALLSHFRAVWNPASRFAVAHRLAPSPPIPPPLLSIDTLHLPEAKNRKIEAGNERAGNNSENSLAQNFRNDPRILGTDVPNVAEKRERERRGGRNLF